MLSRPRRNRSSAAVRNLVRETELNAGHLVQPIFLMPDARARLPIPSLPGTFRLGIDEVLREIEDCLTVGLQSFMMFPAVPEEHKDKTGTYATAEQNFYLHAARAIKDRFPEVCLISDAALDPYSTDGHDGVVINGKIDNDETLKLLDAMSVAQACAGFDVIGPSDMMDGRVGSIRRALDKEGLMDTAIMSYSAKYASAFYGPFRDALDSAPRQLQDVPSDKKTYQMDPANAREALREAALDAAEGADYLMVKPALNYLDIIYRLHEAHTLPIAAYHVSGECAMLLAAAERGWLDYQQAASEALLSIRRAGADVIISYFAKDFARWQVRSSGL
ncbi:porphobilinogen synthase [Lewinella aquimaris]|uniref:Delta-aminolevulinic acid dehydratase n=1 Tax=Neolewinella aquimaris TaxID=1835722 RepID=A0A840E6U3_9BACT|nr:porphobilinogen synthase [Neolewinella aquimaris]MBB4080891.1 porphobilinogen synthase [Neolewinella aquimaris]